VPQVERQALLLRFGLDWTVQAIGFNQGIGKTTAHERVERGIGRLVAYLNGKTYRDVQDGDGEYEDVQV
jgi:DNA-directed RNA polymerase specialized sigma24 family protein